MARLPFNPDRIPEPDLGPPARREQKRYGPLDSASRPLTITQVCELIKRVLADRAPSPLRVVGEVSNFSERGHWYLSLKDEQGSVLNCVVWSAAAKKAGFTPQRGQQVVASGKLDYYGPQGRLQLYIDDLQPVGQGTLELKFRQLCEELRQAGYFAEDRKRTMPAFPQHLAIVTSANGAALHDVIRTARQRWAGVKLTLVDVKVQGDGAAEQVAAALDALGRGHQRLGIDAIILTRGGGSLEDLWAFNERVVADAVFRSPVPIAVGVGHETDTTIAELVADLRCSTPTQAAARLIPDASAERHRLDQTRDRLRLSLTRSARQARQHLDQLAAHPVFRRPAARVEQLRNQLGHIRQRLAAAMQHELAQHRGELSDRLHALSAIEPRNRLKLAQHRLTGADEHLRAAMARTLRQQRDRVEAMARHLESVGPHSVLQRGYSYTTTESGTLIRSTSNVSGGDRIVTHLADGRVVSKVEDDTAATKPTTKPARSRRPRPRGESENAGLFGEA